MGDETTNGEVRDERFERRRILRLGGIAAAGAVAATVATASPAAAGVDGDVVLGSNGNVATTATGIAVTGNTAGYGFGVVDNGLASIDGRKPALLAHATGQNFEEAIYAKAMNGWDAVVASSTGLGYAVRGASEARTAIFGRSVGGHGIEGFTEASSDFVAGVRGQSNNAHGVYGTSTEKDGVRGASVSGAGVSGSSATGDAIIGQNSGTAGSALFGQTLDSQNGASALFVETYGTGSAVDARGRNPSASNPTLLSVSVGSAPAARVVGKAVPKGGAVGAAGHGPALDVVGVASFTRSGSATVAATKNSVVFNVPGGLTATSQALAQLQTNSGGRFVRAAVPNPATGKVTIYLNTTAPTGGVKVAWFVFG